MWQILCIDKQKSLLYTKYRFHSKIPPSQLTEFRGQTTGE